MKRIIGRREQFFSRILTETCEVCQKSTDGTLTRTKSYKNRFVPILCPECFDEFVDYALVREFEDRYGFFAMRLRPQFLSYQDALDRFIEARKQLVGV